MQPNFGKLGLLADAHQEVGSWAGNRLKTKGKEYGAAS